jgi:hypothetical protein
MPVFRQFSALLPLPTAKGTVLLAAASVLVGVPLRKSSLAGGGFFGGLASLPIFSDRVFFLTAWFALGLIAVSAVLVLMASNSLRSGSSGKLSLHVSDTKETGWRIGWAWGIPLLRFRVKWPNAPFVVASLRADGSEELAGLSRGVCSPLVRDVEVTDWFGLVRMTRQLVDPASGKLVVHPARYRSGVPIDDSSFFSESDETNPEGSFEGDRMEMRQYQPGEPVRHMIWTISMRTGGQRQYVRIPEKSGDRSFRIHFATGKEDEAAARLADHLLQDEPMGRQWRFSMTGGGVDWSRTDRAVAREAVAASGGGSHPASREDGGLSGGLACLVVMGPDEDGARMVVEKSDPSRTICLLAVSISSADGSGIPPERAKSILSGGGFRVKVIEMEDERSRKREVHR